MKKVHLTNKIKEYRKKKGYTQQEIAKKIGVSKNTISSYEIERSEPTLHNTALLCKILDCKFEELFYFKED